MRPDAWKEQTREELLAELERLNAHECGLRAQRQDTIYWLEQVILIREKQRLERYLDSLGRTA
jgi:hypothetical protein